MILTFSTDCIVPKLYTPLFGTKRPTSDPNSVEDLMQFNLINDSCHGNIKQKHKPETYPSSDSSTDLVFFD